MRAFIAVAIPEKFNDCLAPLQEEFQNCIVGTMVKPPFHCTLKFLGEIPEDKIEEVRQKLRHIVFPKFMAYITNMGAFPNVDYIKVIWMGLEGKFKELQLDVDTRLMMMFPKEKEFVPHITLARVKYVRDKAYLHHILRKKVNFENFEITEFKLVKSTLTPEGPVYDDIEVFKLA